MLAPKIEAKMLQDLALKKIDRVLEIGTGSGYMAALLGARAQEVVSVEIDPALVAQARKNLQAAGATNVVVEQGLGCKLRQCDAVEQRCQFLQSTLEGQAARVHQLRHVKHGMDVLSHQSVEHGEQVGLGPGAGLGRRKWPGRDGAVARASV